MLNTRQPHSLRNTLYLPCPPLSTLFPSLCYNSEQAANRRRRDAALTKPTRDRSPQEGLAVHAGREQRQHDPHERRHRTRRGVQGMGRQRQRVRRLRSRLRPDVHRPCSSEGRGSAAGARGQELHLLQPDGRGHPPGRGDLPRGAGGGAGAICQRRYRGDPARHARGARVPRDGTRF